MKNATKLIALFVLLALSAFGQTLLSTTTLGAALTSTATTVTLASTSTMLSNGPANQVNTCIYVDKELMALQTVVDSTHAVVSRRGGSCGSTGESARTVAHANGAKVYFSITSGSTSAPVYFGGNTQLTGEVSGSCTATSLMFLPLIYPSSADFYDCKNGSSGGQWVLTGLGTMSAPAGRTITAFCTGTAGSAETEYLNGAACSGATTSTARYVVSVPGTLANLYVVAGTAVTGGTNKDVLTVYKNASATTITCTFATGGAATTCSDAAIGSGHSVNVVPGDIITFQFVSATSDTGANIAAAVSLY